MTRIGSVADRMLSAFVPHTTAAAAAAACTTYQYCQQCGSYWKMCWSQYCNGVYRNGFCNSCGSC